MTDLLLSTHRSLLPLEHALPPSGLVVKAKVANFISAFVEDERNSERERAGDLETYQRLREAVNTARNNLGKGAPPEGERDYDYFNKVEAQLEAEARQEKDLQQICLKLVDPNSYTKELFPGIRGCSGDHTAERMIFEQPEADKVEKVQRLKSEGNDAFKKGELELALGMYQRGLIFADYTFPDTPELTEEYDALVVSLHLNSALICLKLEHYRTTLDHTHQVLWRDPDNIKGFLRKGLALRELGEFEESLEALENGLKVDPENKALQREIQITVDKSAETDATLSKNYSKMNQSGGSKEVTN